MKYFHRFAVKAPVAAVAQFHRQSASMSAITPPPVVVRMQNAPAELANGDTMNFTLWLGPIPVPWSARIEQVTPSGFVDRQLDGPFAEWVHRHRFEFVDDTTTEVVDEIKLRLPRFGFRWFIGFGMSMTLPILFTYRAWKTKQLLEREQNKATV